jgi:hypothetical protein
MAEFCGFSGARAALLEGMCWMDARKVLTMWHFLALIVSLGSSRD